MKRPPRRVAILTLEELNERPAPEAREALEHCCGSSRWVAAMVAGRPYANPDALYSAAERAADTLGSADWLEAFSHHARIGDLGALRDKFGATAAWAGREQSGATGASERTLEALARGNAEYEARFGHIFIVCATGKSAEEMLALLEARLHNAPESELRIAADEQRKITRLRLGKLLGAGA